MFNFFFKLKIGHEAKSPSKIEKGGCKENFPSKSTSLRLFGASDSSVNAKVQLTFSFCISDMLKEI